MTSIQPPPAPRIRRANAQAKEQQRLHILAITNQIYRSDGLEGITIRAVAARAGMSPMGLYKYFASKEALVMGLWDAILTDARDHVGAAIARGGPPRGQLVRSIDAFIDYWESHPDHFRLVYMASQTTAPSENLALTRSSSYSATVDLPLPMLNALAQEMGVGTEHVPLARDLRLSLMTGYLHSRLVNRRVPWTNLDHLRICTVRAIAAAVEDCLRHGTSAPEESAR